MNEKADKEIAEETLAPAKIQKTGKKKKNSMKKKVLVKAKPNPDLVEVQDISTKVKISSPQTKSKKKKESREGMLNFFAGFLNSETRRDFQRDVLKILSTSIRDAHSTVKNQVKNALSRTQKRESFYATTATD